MANNQFDNEDLENLPPEEGDNIAKEAGREFADKAEGEIKEKVREKVKERFEKQDLAKKAGSEAAEQAGSSAVQQAGTTAAGASTAGKAAAAGTEQAGAAVAGKAGAKVAEQAGVAAAQQAGAKVAAEAGGQVAGKVASKLGLRVLGTAFLELIGAPATVATGGVMAVVWFIVGWFILPELILLIPGVRWLLEKIGEAGCAIIMIVLQVIFIIAMIILGIFGITISGLVEESFFGQDPPTDPVKAAVTEQREALKLTFCFTTEKAEEKVRKLEEPPIGAKEQQGSEDENKDAVKMRTAEVKASKEESSSPQLTEKCVKQNAKAVDDAAKAIDKQLDYFRKMQPEVKNLADLEKQFSEFKSEAQKLKDAGSDLSKTRAQAEKLNDIFKKITKALANLEVSCESLNFGAPNRNGMVYLAPSSQIVFYATGSSPSYMHYATPKFACWMVRYAAAIKRELGVTMEWGDISDQFGGNSGRHQTHIGGGIADLWIPDVHPAYGTFNKQRAIQAAQIARRLGAVVLYATTSDPDLTPLVDVIGGHSDHWHVCLHNC